MKGIGGFYYVDAADSIYECRARGVFRRRKVKPLVGDRVRIEVIDEEAKTGNITEILPRKSVLIRPAAANADLVLVLFSVSRPDPHPGLLDRFLCNTEAGHVETVIGFSKTDLDPERAEQLTEAYKKAGYRTIAFSAHTGTGVPEIRACISGKTTVFSGPSGVGKSSLVRQLIPDSAARVGDVSEKIGRGKNTTRESTLLFFAGGAIIDTPGFSAVELTDRDPEMLQYRFREFSPYLGGCRFTGCRHMEEPDCGVKKAVEEGMISRERYKSYRNLYRELDAGRKWK